MGAKNIILIRHDCCLIDNEANFTNYHEKETLTICWNNQDEYNEWLSKIENQTIHIKNILKNNFKINIHSLNPFINYNLEGHKTKNNLNRTKIKKKGILLILSCKKHENDRMKKFKLSKKNYEGYEVIYVLGDFLLNTIYKFDENTNILTLKCEDSYIHLLKKLVLSI
jgi:hypothetical protein